MSIQILRNIQTFLNEVTVKGPACAVWTECANFVQSEIQRRQNEEQAALIEAAVQQLVLEQKKNTHVEVD